jgi:hypothetical protein
MTWPHDRGAVTMYPLITAEQYAADRARRAAERLPCKCGTRLAVQIVGRDMGRSKSYRAKCQGCRKMSDPTFYADKITDRWNEVAHR